MQVFIISAPACSFDRQQEAILDTSSLKFSTTRERSQREGIYEPSFDLLVSTSCQYYYFESRPSWWLQCRYSTSLEENSASPDNRKIHVPGTNFE
jgi:hypothetical protein